MKYRFLTNYYWSYKGTTKQFLKENNLSSTKLPHILNVGKMIEKGTVNLN